MNKIREKLNNGECLFGTQSFLGSKEVAGLLGAMNYDFIFICAEHPSYGYDVIFDLVKYCEASGTPALVRLPEYDLTFTKKVLDAGVSAVLFPMIRSYEDAKKAMDICVYPPYGKRGFGPMAGVKWGLESEADFVKNSKDELVRMIQIEHIDAINELDKIMEIEYIDAYIFGPNDLAASIGHINDMYNEEVQKVIIKAVEKLRKAGKKVGVSLGCIDKDKIQYWKSLGMEIFSLGADFAFIRDGALKAYQDLKDIIKK